MRIEVSLTPALYALRQLREDAVVVAVDVLRATSSICSAFQSGAEAIVPLASLDGLQAYADKGYLIAAERGGRKVEAAQLGNSPTEYAAMELAGRRIAYSTTNGTVAILAAREARRLYVGAFANLSALVSRLAAEPEADVVVLCSGWEGDASIEDTLFAGALVQRLGRALPDVQPLNDAAMMAVTLWQAAESDLYGYCQRATHVHRLQRFGAEEDIRWALTADSCTVVPYYDAELSMLQVLK